MDSQNTQMRARGRPKVVPDDVQAARIVREARELFIAEGYAGTTMAEVASRCRISKRTLYRLFPGKTELFTAIIEAHRQSMLDLPGAYDDIPLSTALEKIFRIDISPEVDRERMAVLHFIIVETQQFPELCDIAHYHGGERALALLSEWLTHQQDLNRIHIDNATNTARVLMDMIFGAIIFKKPGKWELRSQEERTQQIRRCIRIFLDGVRPR